jgi:uncharacterized protein (DUF2342 family)
LEQVLAEPGGLTGFSAGPELEAPRDDVMAMVAILDGFGQALTATAAGDLLPDLGRIRDAAASRSAETGPERILEQMLGIEIDRALAGTARVFSDDLSNRWGPSAWDRLWEGPEGLPTVAELHDPVGWAARAMLPDDFEL